MNKIDRWVDDLRRKTEKREPWRRKQYRKSRYRREAKRFEEWCRKYEEGETDDRT